MENKREIGVPFELSENWNIMGTALRSVIRSPVNLRGPYPVRPGTPSNGYKRRRTISARTSGIGNTRVVEPDAEHTYPQIPAMVPCPTVPPGSFVQLPKSRLSAGQVLMTPKCSENGNAVAYRDAGRQPLILPDEVSKIP
jgi:hypothetical protein